MSRHFDVALQFDAATRSTDVALGADGDLAIDLTPATALLVSIGVDRRAEPDDELPSGRDALLNAASPSFSRRRGFPGDATAPGPRTGSRLWLLDREKQTEITRQRAEDYGLEATQWTGLEPDGPALVAADWPRKGVLGLLVKLGDDEISTARPV
jgi:phage gp46-like protein